MLVSGCSRGAMEISFSLSGELLRLIFGFSWARLDSRMWSVKYYFVATP